MKHSTSANRYGGHVWRTPTEDKAGRRVRRAKPVPSAHWLVPNFQSVKRYWKTLRNFLAIMLVGICRSCWLAVFVALSSCGGRSAKDESPPREDSINYVALRVEGNREVHHFMTKLYQETTVILPEQGQQDSLIGVTLDWQSELFTEWDRKQVEQTLDYQKQAGSLRCLVPATGGKVLHYRYAYDVENMFDEEHGYVAYIVLGSSFKSERGLYYRLPGEGLQVYVWNWNARIGEKLMLKPQGFLRIERIEDSYITAEIELTAIDNTSRPGDAFNAGDDSIANRIRAGLPVDSLVGEVYNGGERLKTIISGRMTFIDSRLKLP